MPTYGYYRGGRRGRWIEAWDASRLKPFVCLFFIDISNIFIKWWITLELRWQQRKAGLFFVLVIFSYFTNIFSFFLDFNDNMLTKDTGDWWNGQEKETRAGSRRIWYVFSQESVLAFIYNCAINHHRFFLISMTTSPFYRRDTLSAHASEPRTGRHKVHGAGPNYGYTHWGLRRV